MIIALSASMYNSSSQVSVEDLQFPKPEDLVNYTTQLKPIVAVIPPRLLEERSRLQDASSSSGIALIKKFELMCAITTICSCSSGTYHFQKLGRFSTGWVVWFR